MNTNENESNVTDVVAEAEPVIRKGRLFKVLGAIVIVAVIALNLLASVLGEARLWYIDLTKTKYKSAESAFYTLSESCKSLISADAEVSRIIASAPV